MIAEAVVERGSATPTDARRTSAGVLLASRSPRRRELLREVGIDHDVATPEFEDGVLRPGRTTPEGWVMSVAFLKAWSMRGKAQAGQVVLGADTACVLDGRLIGTPRDADEAVAMLRAFAGRDHDVVTGVALLDAATGRRRLFAERATVRFGTVRDSAVQDYAATGLWAGKAGAYNLSERLAAGWPISYQGEASTIMGLPVRRVAAELARFRVGRAA